MCSHLAGDAQPSAPLPRWRGRPLQVAVEVLAIGHLRTPACTLPRCQALRTQSMRGQPILLPVRAYMRTYTAPSGSLHTCSCQVAPYKPRPMHCDHSTAGNLCSECAHPSGSWTPTKPREL